VRVLQENDDARHSRAVADAAANLLTRDEAREIMGFDPIDNAPVFVGNGGAKTLDDQMKPPEPPPALMQGKPQAVESTDEIDAAEADEIEQTKAAEVEKFKSFAKKRIKEGKVLDIPEYEFKSIEPEHAAALVAMYAAPALFAQMDKALKAIENEQ
jgi:hypothetical protein